MGNLLFQTGSQLAFLYLFLFSGMFFSRKNLIKKETDSGIAVLLAQFFLPCMLVSSLSEQFDRNLLNSYVLYLIAGILTVLVLWYPIKLLAKRLTTDKDSCQRGILSYAMLFPNISFFGYPLVEATLPQFYLPLMIYSLPFTVVANTLGLGLLSCKKKEKTWNNILSPTVIGTLLGILLVLLMVKLPKPFSSFLSSASDCTGPLAMLFTGLVLGRPVEHTSKKQDTAVLAIVMLFRLILIPALVSGGILLVCHIAKLPYELAITAATALCLPCGMNMIFLTGGQDEGNATTIRSLGAKCVLISNSISLITVPLIYAAISFFIEFPSC